MWPRFGKAASDFEREVKIELDYLKKVHGADALRVALEKSRRPGQRTFRRHVLDEVVKRLSDVADGD